MEITDAAVKLRPGTSWNYDEGRGLTQAEDSTPRVSIPTMDEIRSCIANDPLAYQAKRSAEYPSITDQLDAVWQGGQVQSDMQAKILAVKAKYPKPE